MAKKKKAEPIEWYITVEEKMRCGYTVEAKDETEARELFEAGQAEGPFDDQPAYDGDSPKIIRVEKNQ